MAKSEMTKQNYDDAIRSVNWHITSRCNYTCKFCFSRDRGLEIHDICRARTILGTLKERGIEKINLAGGEPLLHPLFFDILHLAKDIGFVTSIVTNGSLLDDRMLTLCKGDLDWIGLSVDSPNEKTELSLGRGNGGHVAHITEVVGTIHRLGIKLKINTVVMRPNYREQMGPFIESLAPHRWKVFQYLHMRGCNDDYSSDLKITSEQFELFINNHKGTRLREGASPVFERNEEMLGSYLMLTPDGQLIVDKGCEYRKVSWNSFIGADITDFIDIARYSRRGGVYDW